MATPNKEKKSIYNRRYHLKKTGRLGQESVPETAAKVWLKSQKEAMHETLIEILETVKMISSMLGGVKHIPPAAPFPAPRGSIASIYAHQDSAEKKLALESAIGLSTNPAAIGDLAHEILEGNLNAPSPKGSTGIPSDPTSTQQAAQDVLDGFLNVNPTTRTDLNDMCDKHKGLEFNEVVKIVNVIAKTEAGKEMIATENWRGFRKAMFEAGLKAYGPQK
jgi:hypothetical protein